MEVNQALSVLFQATDVAVGGGVFKGTRDVAVIDQAKQVLAQFVEANSDVKNMQVDAEEVNASKKAK